jgi:hypothetical protein
MEGYPILDLKFLPVITKAIIRRYGNKGITIRIFAGVLITIPGNRELLSQKMMVTHRVPLSLRNPTSDNCHAMSEFG